MHRSATIAAAVAAAALTVGAGPASAGPKLTTVHCGQTLTQSVKLANDLTDCSGDGLVIGADGITVDLNGHTVDGTATQLTDCDVPPFGPTGINDESFDRVTIANGTVQQFFNGVGGGGEGVGMADSDLHGMTVRDNRFSGISLGSDKLLNNNNRIEHNETYGNGCGAGIGLNDADANRVAHNSSHDNRTGIAVCCSPNDVVEHNVVAHNAEFGIAVYFGHGSHNVVRHNEVTGNGADGIVIAFNEGDQQDEVVDNHSAGNQGAGVLLDDGAGNVIRGNRLDHDFFGVLNFGDRNAITDNHISDIVGCNDVCGFGIGIAAGDGNVVAHNDVARVVADGIGVAAYDPGSTTSNTTVRDNTVRAARRDDYSVGTLGEGTLTATTLLGNHALDAGDDGIDVGLPGTTLTGNIANHNADLGISAVPGTTDGGANAAHANGNPAQCTGVACT